jgi:hypothetical protein
MIRILRNCIALTSLLLCLQAPAHAQIVKKPEQREVPGIPKSGTPGDVLKCAVPELTDEQRRTLEIEMTRAAQNKNAGGRVQAGITWVPIRPHIFRRNDGNGGYSLNSLNNILAITNSYHMKNGTGIQFFYAGTSFDYIDNTNWYNNYTSNIEGVVAGSRDAPNALNQYYINYTSEGWGGYAYYPTNSVVSTRSFILTSYPETEEDLAHRVVPHELGHNFNLIHTFGYSNGSVPSTELVTRGAGANCSYSGDLLCDTPADPFGKEGNSVLNVNGCVSYNGTALDANGELYTPSLSNLMGYYQSCTHDFVQGQYDRMQAALALRQTHTAYSLTYPSTNVPAVTNLTATFNSTAATVVLNWQDNASNEMGYFIERSISPTTDFIPIGGVGPNMTTYTDTKAGATTTYYYRIRPSNSTAGISEVASTATDCFAPKNTKTIDVTTTSAEFNWGASGTGVNYDLRWRKSGTSAWTNVTNLNTPEHTISGLTPGVSYEWQVRNKCTSGSSAYTASATFSTASCPSPTGIANTNITTNSAQLSWINLGLGSTYELRWKPTSAADWTTVSNLTSPNYLLTGLAEATVYEWQVRRGCEMNTFSEYSNGYFNTLSPNCTPSHLGNCTNFDGLNAFSLNGIALSENSGCSPNGYSLFPGTTVVAPGQTVPFTAQFLNAINPEGMAIWMDANRNGLFEANERVFYTPSTVATSVSANLTIPITTPGPLPMRVTVALYTTPDNSCGDYSLGETEDYVLTVAGDIVTCKPTYNFGCSDGDGLKKVVLDGVVLSDNSGCSPDSYAAMPGTANIRAGQTVSISGDRLNASWPEGIAGWLDLNRNSVFETDELVFGINAAPGPFSGSMTIPAGLAPGPIKFRMVTSYEVVPSNACGTYSFGETEDYTLTVVDPSECSVNMTSVATALTCTEPTITLTATTTSPNATYLWSNGAATASIDVSTAGNYSVTITSDGCSATQSKTITGSGTAITAVISGSDQITCGRPRITLTAETDSQNASYLWSTGAATRTINVTTTGVYGVTITDRNCVASASKTITGTSAQPTVNITSAFTALNCSRTSITLTASTAAPNPSYLWSTGETSRQITVTTAGNYSVVITSGGCIASAEKNITGITDPLTLRIAGATVLTCASPAASLSALTNLSSNLTYKWNTGATTGSLAVRTPGTYYVDVTSDGCTASDTVEVTSTIEVPTITTSIPSTLTYCSFSSVPALALAGTPSSVVFDISGGGSIGLFNATGVTEIPAFTPLNYGESPVTATITVTPKTSCTTGSPITFSITVNPSQEVYVTGATELCAGASTLLTGTPAGGTWQSKYPSLASVSNGLVRSLEEGVAVITYTFEGTNGCKSVIDHYIEISASSLAIAGDQVTRTVGAASSSIFAEDCRIIASVVPSGVNPVSGDISARVYIDGSVPSSKPYVARHYDLSPAVNAASATATITLYFTQEDFDNYNIAAGATLLPSSPSGNKTNLYVNQFHGTSATGGIDTYSDGAAAPFRPAESNIVWNAELSRWEITFDVTGFSGFFITGTPTPLPVTLTRMKASVFENRDVSIEWETSSEVNFDHFELQKSTDPQKGFAFLANVAPEPTKGKYQFTDKAVTSGVTHYYRLKMIDLDASYALSKIVSARLGRASLEITVFPNPAGEELVIISSDIISGLKLINNAGIILLDKPSENFTRTEKLNVSGYQPGVYQMMIRLQDGSEVSRKVLLAR